MTNWYYYNENGKKVNAGLVGVVGLLLPLFFAVFTGCGNSELNDALKRGLEKDVLPDVLEITNIAVNWTDKSADGTSGKFTVKLKTTEGLCEAVTNEAGLKKLGITDLYEKESNDASRKNSNLPTNLRCTVPQENPSLFRFYDVLVPKGGEVILTGSVELTKSGNSDWKVSRYLVDPFSCGDKFTPESKLREEEYKLDDPKTKDAVNAVVQSRKDFVRKVDSAEKGWEQQKETDRKEREAEVQRQREALAKLLKDAEGGNTDSQYQLGKRYDIGDAYVDRSVNDAATWYRRAADQGHTEALRRFAELYLSGSAAPSSETEEIKWLREAADLGHAEAQHRLGMKYRNGEGVPKDDAEGKVWLDKAAAQGYKEALETTRLDNAIPLTAAIQQSGFGNMPATLRRGSALVMFVEYGNSRLESALSVAMSLRPDELDDAGRRQAREAVEVAQAAIRNEQAKIAGTVFFDDYTISVSNDQNYNDGNSRLDIRISTDIRHPRIGEVSLPISNVKKASELWSGSGIHFSVIGNTDRIAELRNNSNSYRARVWFANLRGGGSVYATPNADILRIEIRKPPTGGGGGGGQQVAETVDFPYTTVAHQYKGDDSSLTLRVIATKFNPNARFVQPKDDVISFPVEMNVTEVAVKESGRTLELFITGHEDALKELARNGTERGNWRVKMQFGPQKNNNGIITADILRFELVR